MIKMSVSKVITKKEVDELLKTEVSKSQKIIKLFEGGLDVKNISTLMGIRYNFSYNVISNYIRMNDVKGVIKEEKENKKSEIIKLYKEGKSNIEISTELKCNYNYVWKICNELVGE